MNPFIIFIYIWSAIVILDIINNKAYKRCSRTVRYGMPANKLQLVYCHKAYFLLSIIFRVLLYVCTFINLFAGLVTLAKYIWIYVLVDLK